MKTKRLKDLEKEADELWRKAVRKKYSGRCAVCGKEGCDPHHVFLRKHKGTRWELTNGIWLCRLHHNGDYNMSAHGTPAKFLEWVMERIGEKKFDALFRKSQTVFQPTEKGMEEIIDELKSYL